jgi:hypothetical protein
MEGSNNGLNLKYCPSTYLEELREIMRPSVSISVLWAKIWMWLFQNVTQKCCLFNHTISVLGSIEWVLFGYNIDSCWNESKIKYKFLPKGFLFFPPVMGWTRHSV